MVNLFEAEMYAAEKMNEFGQLIHENSKRKAAVSGDRSRLAGFLHASIALGKREDVLADHAAGTDGTAGAADANAASYSSRQG